MLLCEAHYPNRALSCKQRKKTSSSGMLPRAAELRLWWETKHRARMLQMKRHELRTDIAREAWQSLLEGQRCWTDVSNLLDRRLSKSKAGGERRRRPSADKFPVSWDPRNPNLQTMLHGLECSSKGEIGRKGLSTLQFLQEQDHPNQVTIFSTYKTCPLMMGHSLHPCKGARYLKKTIRTPKLLVTWCFSARTRQCHVETNALCTLLPRYFSFPLNPWLGNRFCFYGSCEVCCLCLYSESAVAHSPCLPMKEKRLFSASERRLYREDKSFTAADVNFWPPSMTLWNARQLPPPPRPRHCSSPPSCCCLFKGGLPRCLCAWICLIFERGGRNAAGPAQHMCCNDNEASIGLCVIGFCFAFLKF